MCFVPLRVNFLASSTIWDAEDLMGVANYVFLYIIVLFGNFVISFFGKPHLSSVAHLGPCYTT